jgi:hypothetical protein
MVDIRRLPVGEEIEGITVTLDELAREGARRMIATALHAEVTDYVARFANERDADGKRLVMRNGRARQRRVAVGSGTVALRAARQRQAHRRGHRRPPAVQLADLAGIRAPLDEGDRPAAGAVPARALDQLLHRRDLDVRRWCAYHRHVSASTTSSRLVVIELTASRHGALALPLAAPHAEIAVVRRRTGIHRKPVLAV